MQEIEMLAEAIAEEAEPEKTGPDFEGLIASLQEIVYSLTEAVGMMKAGTSEPEPEPDPDPDPEPEPDKDDDIDE